MAEQEQRIDMKDAVDIATTLLKQLYSEIPLKEVLLEEIVYSSSAREWEVTLGFALPFRTTTYGSLSNVLPQSKPRAYKKFKIDASTGEFRGMLDGMIDED